MGLRSSLGVADDKRYDISGAYLTSANRAPVSSISEARQVLRSAAVRRDDAGAPQRIVQALELIPTLPRSERFPKPAKALATAGAAAQSSRGEQAETAAKQAETAAKPAAEAASSSFATMLRGEWLLGFTATGRAITFAPPAAAQTLRPGAKFERLAPSGPVGAIVKTEGTFELVETASEASLRMEVESATLGPLPLPTLGRSTDEQLVLLDPLMCITRPNGGGSNTFAVWVRPSMASTQAKDALEE